MTKNINRFSYKSSGVNIDKADKLMSKLTPLIKETYNESVLQNIGGFSSILDIKKLGYQDPILMSTTDGVGTKLQLAINTNKLFNIGIDLVAMCVNDIVAQGGKPHFFMDYIATGKLNDDQIIEIIKGVIQGCKLSNCALVGGETAEMPGHYPKNSLDLAGFCIGAAERKNVLSKDNVKENNIAVAVQSSGLHSNGYSLIRNLINKNSINVHDKAPFDKKKSLLDILLEPTIIYSSLFEKIRSKIQINGVTHITGGGLVENPPRTFSKDLSLIINMKSYEMNNIFHWIKKETKLNWLEIFKTFNCGVGLLLFIDKNDENTALTEINKNGLNAWVIGEITKNKNGKNVNFIGMKKT